MQMHLAKVGDFIPLENYNVGFLQSYNREEFNDLKVRIDNMKKEVRARGQDNGCIAWQHAAIHLHGISEKIYVLLRKYYSSEKPLIKKYEDLINNEVARG